jgi:hypothetical protein
MPGAIESPKSHKIGEEKLHKSIQRGFAARSARLSLAWFFALGRVLT